MLLEEIKSQTRRFHERVESDLDIMGDAFTLDDYRRLLGRFFGYVEPWEVRVRTALGSEAAIFEGREKAARLERDLRFLGMGDDELAALPRCGEMPELDSIASALGSMYVFEGATLGGQYITRHLAKRFGMSEGGGSFFNSYGEEVGRMWKGFREILTAHSSTDADPPIIEAAVQTFERFGRWMEGRGS